MSLSRVSFAVLSFGLIAACGSSSKGSGSGGTSASSTSVATTSSTSSGATGGGGATSGTGGGATTSSGTGGAGGSVSASMNGCGVADYMDETKGTDNDRMIMENGGVFDMPCMTILAGQSIMFMWDFAKYPLAPGLAPGHAGDSPGDMPTPIKMKMTGSTTMVKFPTAGMYPFHVTTAPTMSGVIEVK